MDNYRVVRKLRESRASLVAQTVKNPPAMWESWVQSLGLENPLEEGMATHSSILAWRIPRERGVWQATVHGVTKNRTRLNQLSMHALRIVRGQEPYSQKREKEEKARLSSAGNSEAGIFEMAAAFKSFESFAL